MQRYLGRHLLFENHHEIERDDITFHCVYCGYAAPSDEWCTPQQRAWMEKVATVLEKEIRWEQMSYPWRTLRDNPQPTFVAVPPPDRLPEMRAESDDMQRTSFFCCVEDVKVDASWAQSLYCPRCGSEHQRGEKKQVAMSLAVERA